ncbi:MAG: hypothetical protein JRC90_03340 [Deltaproteobacteria bacterium]|nr:hypothetical protein [Deltaproteobacteria bacterium]
MYHRSYEIREFVSYFPAHPLAVLKEIAQVGTKSGPSRNQVPAQVTAQVTAQDERVQRILEFCQIPRAREEIQGFIKIKDREYFRKNFLQPLLQQGLLKLTIPDKPTSSRQKYYATKEKKTG